MGKVELTPLQKKAIGFLSKSELCKTFYWTGGTLLSVYYLKHRKSLDIDLFSEKEFSYSLVNAWVQNFARENYIKDIESRKVFDRWEFKLIGMGEQLCIDFAYYNHDKKTLVKRKKYLGVYIDSIEDIAANKVMAFFDRDEPKDIFDIYFIIKKTGLAPKTLLSFVEKKFGAKFSEDMFWSESFKALPLLKSLKPLLACEKASEQNRILEEVEKFFKDRSSNFIDSIIDSY